MKAKGAVSIWVRLSNDKGGERMENSFYAVVGKITVTIVIGFVTNYFFHIWLTAKERTKK